MRCPACDHEASRTEKILNEQVGRLTRQLMEYKQAPTLRDQFAMAALTGLLAQCAGTTVHIETINDIGKSSYMLADRMLAARG